MLTVFCNFVISLILVVFLGSALMKKRLAGRLEQALRKKDYDAYRKMIYARSATVFLNPNTILLLRASDQMASGNRDAAKKILPAIRVMRRRRRRSSLTCSCAARRRWRPAMFLCFRLFRRSWIKFRTLPLQDMIADLREENEINQSLYGVYDRRVIPVLESQVSRNERSEPRPADDVAGQSLLSRRSDGEGENNINHLWNAAGNVPGKGYSSDLK